MMPALAGGSLGALLGQASDTLGEPRRQLMNALGLPEQGSELLSAILGMDPNDPLTQLGGAGVEMATDPLSYLGFLGGAMKPLMAGAGAADKLGDVSTLGRAAMSANAANEANGLRLGTEQLGRMGGAFGVDDMMAAGPRTGLYNRDLMGKSVNPLTPPSPIPATSTTISPDVQKVSAATTSKKSPIIAKRNARDAQMGANVTANDEMMGKASAAYNDPFENQGFALPGMMLSPQNPMRGNIMAQLNPQDAMAGIEPLLAQMGQAGGAAAAQGLSPWELALLTGAGGGAVGGGIYAGQNIMGR